MRSCGQPPVQFTVEHDGDDSNRLERASAWPLKSQPDVLVLCQVPYVGLFKLLMIILDDYHNLAEPRSLACRTSRQAGTVPVLRPLRK